RSYNSDMKKSRRKFPKGILNLLVGFAAFMAAVPAFAGDGGMFYTNPVIKTTLPDPTVMRAADGYFYLFATEDINSDTAEASHNVPIYKSSDVVSWQFVGTAFTDEGHPSFLPKMNRITAPDINLINGKYVLYYSILNWDHTSNSFTTWDVQWIGHGVGVAVADRIEGPYTDLGKLFVSTDVDVQSSIDQCYVEDEDGSKWLFWGSYHGIYAIQLSDDGLSIREGAKKQRVAGSLTEGTMVYRHDGYYYMVGSTGSCCNGAQATYRLVVSRSKELLGPYVDKNGLPALGNFYSELQKGNGRVLGPGHCSEFIEDDAGQTWLLYHGYQADAWETGRVTYLSQVMWDSEGWPYVVGDKVAVTWDRPLFGRTQTYTDASYIEFTGSSDKNRSLFDTGYVPKENTRIEVRCRAYSKNAKGEATAGKPRSVFAGHVTKSDGYSLHINQSGDYWGFTSCGYINDNVTSHGYDTDYTVTVCRSSINIDGREYPADTSAYCATTGRLTIFGEPLEKAFCGRVYYLKIYEGDALVHDYRPCVRNEDGMPVFHDLVTGTYIRPDDPEGFSCGNVTE
ncbi:MAG: family 43 glycosylhydrolase, partial [Clostridia bacterium]|nr:family 43 glycosylhydrolase [Clostridia bacterium]